MIVKRNGLLCHAASALLLNPASPQRAGAPLLPASLLTVSPVQAKSVQGMFRSKSVPSQKHHRPETDDITPETRDKSTFHRSLDVIESIQKTEPEIIIRESTFLVTDFCCNRFSYEISDVELEEDELEMDEPADGAAREILERNRRRRIALTADLKGLEGEIKNIKSQIMGLRGVLKVCNEQLNERLGEELRMSWNTAVKLPDVERAFLDIEEQEFEIERCEALRRELEEQVRWVRLML